MLNADLENNADKRELWATPGWLPIEIGLVSHEDTVLCFEGEGLRNLLRTRKHPEPTIYDLVGFVADINSGEQQKSHLVSFVNGMDLLIPAQARVLTIKRSCRVRCGTRRSRSMASFQ